ncbi:hypothetical protein T492DRAFT_844527 [Pavlovales sp. CCMP2436]|nr:hypothetical protein T492DRAFT_844527 [Pavlovales sp. CCMP2436]
MDSLNVAFPQYGARTPALATGPHTLGPEMWLLEEMRQRLAGQLAGGALLYLHPPGGQATLPVPSDMRPGFATQGGAEQQRGTEERSPLPLNGGYIPLGPGLSPLPAASQAQVSAGGQGTGFGLGAGHGGQASGMGSFPHGTPYFH